MVSVEIYFNDLNERGKKKILNATKAENAAELNMDIDVIPLFYYDVEEESDED